MHKLRLAAGLCVGLSAFVFGQRALALDTQQDDFIPLPSGTNVVLGYYGFSNYNEFSPVGQPKITHDTNAQAQVGILRYVHYQTIFGMPSLISGLQTFGGFTNAELGGETLGKPGFQLGDLTIGGFVWPINHPSESQYLAVGGYIHIADGNWNSKVATNLTDNRISGTAQVAFIQGITPKLDLQAVGDGTFYGDNTDATPAGGTLVQQPTYELQLWSMYHLTPLSTLAFGVAGTYGGYSSVDHVATAEKTEYQQVKFSYTHFFVGPKMQLQI